MAPRLQAIVAVTFILFHWAGMTISAMTLGGLAIVDVENIYSRLTEKRRLANPRPSFQVIIDASQEERSGIVYSTFVIILVFIPVFAIPSLQGRLFAPLGVACITLTGISTRNGILKVSQFINPVLHEGETFGRKTIIRGSLERLVPVLMTATSACCGLLPLLVRPYEPARRSCFRSPSRFSAT